MTTKRIKGPQNKDKHNEEQINKHHNKSCEQSYK